MDTQRMGWEDTPNARDKHVHSSINGFRVLKEQRAQQSVLGLKQFRETAKREDTQHHFIV